MGRSSSSRRKKRSKVRAPKRSKIGKRKYETKKLRRHVSDDDDDSRSSMSGSSYSSSSEDSKYRSKKSRVRIRKHVASRKKKFRKISYSSESSEDSRRGRKRGGSKRKRDRENKNIMYSKKKRRRDDSISSASRFRSCSTCQDDSIGSPGIKSERYGRRHGIEERDEGNLDKVESAYKSGRYRSRSPSCSECSESSEYGMTDKVVVENNSRRLRSVITVVQRDEEGRDFNRDEHKEEIVYDHDDYPSCRSNDSNDTGRQREEGDNGSPIDREKKMRLENEKGDNTVISNFRTPKEAENEDLFDGDDGDQFDGRNRRSEFGKVDTTNDKMSDVPISVGEMQSDDLESVLRLRALENLRRFRGVMRTNGGTVDNWKGQSDGNTKHSSFSNAESVPVMSAAEDSSKVVCANSTKEDGPDVVVSTKSQLATGISVPAPKKTSQIEENRTDGNTDGNESMLTKQNSASINRTEVVGNSNEKVKVGISSARPKLVRPALMRQLSKSNSTLNQSPRRQEPQAELLATGSNLDETGAVTAPTLIQNPENNGVDINTACNSAAAEPSLPSSDKAKGEANESSQFEQKTMSVMRGGEMVQVSYKVYIPKKAPALARRQLKR